MSFLAEKTVTIKNSAIKPKGAPEDKARAFEKPGTDRSTLFKPGKGKYHAVEFSDEGDFIMILMMRDDVEPSHFGGNSPTDDQHKNYYGVNVLFKKDGTIEAATDDPRSAKQWKNDRDVIIRAAKAALKDKDLPAIYDGLGGRANKRGTGKLSFEIDESTMFPTLSMLLEGYGEGGPTAGQMTASMKFKAARDFTKDEFFAVCAEIKEPRGWLNGIFLPSGGPYKAGQVYRLTADSSSPVSSEWPMIKYMQKVLAKGKFSVNPKAKS